MVTSIALFNHKGGVGKTTLTVNIARAFGQLGVKTLLVDADPQCNATAFYLPEDAVDSLLDESVDPEEGGTIWSGIAKYVRGRGEVRAVATYDVGPNVALLPGDVLLGGFEDRLSTAWRESFSRDATAIDLMSAIFRSAQATAESVDAQLIMYDVGPSVGSLNRSVLLGCDHYCVPVGCDLFSLRALKTVGRTVSSWVRDWSTIAGLVTDVDDVTLLPGTPAFVGYVTQHFNIYRGRSTKPFAEWEARIAPRVTRDLISPLRVDNPALAPNYPSNKLGEVPAFHGLAPLAQDYGMPIGGLRNCQGVNSGYYEKIAEADELFLRLANQLKARMGL
ncbi:AAA family ATPase [Sorangium sp. So ce281]|uniref:ParA family protein n=1 Tax=unclassified Sorangium TaxID=2621164 RepID=UPI003F5E2A46